MNPGAVDKKKHIIFAVDDGATNLLTLEAYLIPKGYIVEKAINGIEALEKINEWIPDNLPDLILLDVMMPDMSGFEVCRALRNLDDTKSIPIILVTALDQVEAKVEGLDAGANDFLTKPVNKHELYARIDSHLRVKKLMAELEIKNKLLAEREAFLDHLVKEKTIQLYNMNIGLVSALETANLANDDDTGRHIMRVGEYSAAIAEHLGCSSEFCAKIKLYAPLHDVGKVGISDAILKKPGKYTPEEFEKMKEHVAIGARMLENASIDKMAYNIAAFHHEKWDGSGYLHGKSGEDIPLEARIVAICDVYDALTKKRVYKSAFPESEADEIIKISRGKHFDPIVTDSFFKIKNSLLEIKNSLKDNE